MIMADIYHDYTRKLEDISQIEEFPPSSDVPPIQQNEQFDNFTVPGSNVVEKIRNVYYGIENRKEQYFITSDHCYARPWNWKPELSFLRPTKTLFSSKLSKTKFPSQLVAADQDVNAHLDIEGIENESPPIYNVERANELMEECENYVKLFKSSGENHLWEDTILKYNWTQTEIKLFNGMVSILSNHQLAKLAFTGVKYEAIQRRTIIDKSVQRIRRLMASVFWDQKLTQWLHQLLLENLSADYMSIYLEILQTLKAKLPSFVERMMYGHNAFKSGGNSTETLAPVLKRPWDPVISSSLDKPRKLPGNCLICVIPSSPITSDRYLKWINLLSNLAAVVSIPLNSGTPGQRLTTMHCADQMFSSVRGQIQDVKNENPDKSLVLLGFNAGAALALQIANVEPVLAVICLGFSLLSAEGKRGEVEDTLMELQSPVLFVIGQCSTSSSQEDMEELRERMRVETGLVVVGSADNYLRISKKKKRAEGITQNVVDRCIMDEIGEFVGGIILSPYPPQLRQSPTPLVSDSTLAKKIKSGRRRYNSNTSSLDSEENTSPKPIKISRPVGRPPGSKTKSRLEVKWAAQVAQGTPSQNPTSPSPNSTPPLTPVHLDSSSNDSFLDKNSDKMINFTSKSKSKPLSSTETSSPLKKVKTLKPVLSSISSDKTSLNNTVSTSSNKGFPNKGPATFGPAKMQAYGMAKNTVVPGSRLSSLLQGGLKTIPPTQPKNSPSTIRVLENVTLTPGNSKMLPNTPGKTITLVNTMGAVKQTGGNVILLPDGKIRTIGVPNINRGPRYITSKKQLMGNKPPRSVSKFVSHKSPAITTNLPPPKNLTSQDIMDLPIIFADDNQILDTSLPSGTSSQTLQQCTQVDSPAPKIITPGNKFVVVNRPINFNSNNTNFVISQTPMKKSSTNIYRQTPKYTKIILSKRTPDDGSSHIISRIANLSSEISVKKVSAPISSIPSTMQMQNIDLENELVATTIPKPIYSSELRNVTMMSQKIPSMKNEIYSNSHRMKDERMRINSPVNNDGDDSDPDYVPPKMVKLN